MRSPVHVDLDGAVATIRLDAPPMNPFDTAMRQALARAVADLSDDEQVRAVVLWGGPDCFAAGADIEALATMGYEQVIRWNRALQMTFTAVADLPVPVVAALNGFALGGGLELALAADFRIGGHRTSVGLPEVSLGIMPGSGGTQRLVRHVGPSRAKELMMTGRRVRADAALELGLLDEVVADDDVIARATALANELATGPRFALAAIKEAVDHPGDGLALERSLLAGLFATIDKQRGMASFLHDGPGAAEFT